MKTLCNGDIVVRSTDSKDQFSPLQNF